LKKIGNISRALPQTLAIRTAIRHKLAVCLAYKSVQAILAQIHRPWRSFYVCVCGALVLIEILDVLFYNITYTERFLNEFGLIGQNPGIEKFIALIVQIISSSGILTIFSLQSIVCLFFI
jgi:hypothetical protein